LPWWRIISLCSSHLNLEILKNCLKDYANILYVSRWTDARQEIRSHARTLGCNFIMGYSEDAVVWEDVVVLRTTGTAVVADLTQILDLDSKGLFGPPFLRGRESGESGSHGIETAHSPPRETTTARKSGDSGSSECPSSLLHAPHPGKGYLFPCRTTRCGVCKKVHIL